MIPLTIDIFDKKLTLKLIHFLYKNLIIPMLYKEKIKLKQMTFVISYLYDFFYAFHIDELNNK